MLHADHGLMSELTTIGDYDVKMIEADGAVVRYAATHVVLPRHAIIELLEPDASQADAVKLARHACILEALRHASVPRVYECGKHDGRLWVAFAEDEGATLADELADQRLEVGDVLDMLEQVAAILHHAHARGVLHGNISPRAIVRLPKVLLTGWDGASCTEHDGPHDNASADVFALARTCLFALTTPVAMPTALATLLARMLAKESLRPSAAEVASTAFAIRGGLPTKAALAPTPEELESVLAMLGEDPGPEPESVEIHIDYEAGDHGPADDEPLLLDRPVDRIGEWTPVPVVDTASAATAAALDAQLALT